MCYIKHLFVSIQDPEHVQFFETDLNAELTYSQMREGKTEISFGAVIAEELSIFFA